MPPSQLSRRRSEQRRALAHVPRVGRDVAAQSCHVAGRPAPQHLGLQVGSQGSDAYNELAGNSVVSGADPHGNDDPVRTCEGPGILYQLCILDLCHESPGAPLGAP